MNIAVRLGEKINALDHGAVPLEALHWAKQGILDTVGVTLAGAEAPCTQMVARMVAAEAGSPAGIAQAGGALLFGFGQRTSASNAALVNGTAAHALDFDDCSNTLGGHPSAPILPGLIALGEIRGASGRDVILAYLAGFETETAIAKGVNFHHYEKGWHPTATLGTFGAAAAGAKLIGLDAERTAIALAISASMASGIKANFGTGTKPLHVGHCARNGLTAALLSEQNYTANLDAFEHRQGFLELFNGAGNYDSNRIGKGWADPFNIVDPGLAIKQHPCCGSTHPAVDAMLKLRRENDLTADNVASVVSWTHPRRLSHTNRPDPQGPLDAKFSVQYVLARALSEGRVAIEHFEGDAFNDPQVRRLMERITAEPHPKAVMDTTEHFFAEVTVTKTDGKSVSTWLDQPVGRGPDSPLPPGALAAKFQNCAERVLTRAAADELRAMIEDLETVDNIREMTALIGDATPDRENDKRLAG